MHYVHVIRSQNFPEEYYIGQPSDLKNRLSLHNAGEVKSTEAFLPRVIANYHAFANTYKAKNFEIYLKSGSGQAFSKKHLR